MNSNSTSIKNIIVSSIQLSKHLLSKWKILIVAFLAGGTLGLVYKAVNKPTYIAEATFSLELGGNNSMASSLGALGFGGTTPVGLFDEVGNIIWLYSSDLMVKSTLLSKSSDGRCLIDKFIIENSKLNNLVSNDPKLRTVRFTPTESLDSLKSLGWNQSRILDLSVDLINSSYLLVEPEGKTASIVRVKFSSKDESFSKLFVEALVRKVNSYYLGVKTKKYERDIALLEAKADSIKRQVNSSIYQVAKGFDDVPYANPNRQTAITNSQKSKVDAEVATMTYSSLIQNLETSRLSLAKETPLIQVIDLPIFPLPNNNKSWATVFLAGGFVLFFLAIIVYALIAQYRRIMQ